MKRFFDLFQVRALRAHRYPPPPLLTLGLAVKRV
jgi:hypothetical protein